MKITVAGSLPWYIQEWAHVVYPEQKYPNWVRLFLGKFKNWISLSMGLRFVHEIVAIVDRLEPFAHLASVSILEVIYHNAADTTGIYGTREKQGEIS